MSDREREAFRKAVETVAPAPALDRVHPAIVRNQRDDGTLDVDFEEGGPQPRASGVEPTYGLPGVFCRFAADARLHVAYKAGDPRKRIATHYGSYPPVVNPELVAIPNLPVVEINLCNATDQQSAARKNDATNTGKILFMQTPVGPGGVPSTLTISYQNAAGATVPVLTFPIPGPALMLALDPDFPDPTTAVIPLAGVITGGSTIVKIGG
jgi:hypothetical protein